MTAIQKIEDAGAGAGDVLLEGVEVAGRIAGLRVRPLDAEDVAELVQERVFVGPFGVAACGPPGDEVIEHAGGEVISWRG